MPPGVLGSKMPPQHNELEVKSWFGKMQKYFCVLNGKCFQACSSPCCLVNSRVRWDIHSVTPSPMAALRPHIFLSPQSSHFDHLCMYSPYQLFATVLALLLHLLSGHLPQPRYFSISILSSPPDPLLPSRFLLFDSAPSQPISFVHTHRLALNLIHQSAFRTPITFIVHGQPPIHFSQWSRIGGCGNRSLGSVVGSCGWEQSLRYFAEIGMFGIGLSRIRRWDCSLGSVPQM